MLRDPTDTYARYGLALCTYDRPGYGLSTRRLGRTHAQTVDDVAAIADALGWDRFGVAGASGGAGPALAVAALLPGLVARCAVVVGVAPLTADEVVAAMSEDDLQYTEREARGDEEELTRQFEHEMRWVDAGMPDVEFGSDAQRPMLEETIDEAGKQGAFGYIDDSIATARDWGLAVEDVRVPTKIMGRRAGQRVRAVLLMLARRSHLGSGTALAPRRAYGSEGRSGVSAVRVARAWLVP